MGLISALALSTAPALAAPDPLRSHQWGLDMIGADGAHVTAQGAGAVVAVIDTGVKTDHPDLQGRLLAGYDQVAGAGGPVTRDGNGHGTHVSGIIAANAGNGIGIEGVAPLAKILPVRVLGDDGSGSQADVAAGVNWAVDHGADVINLSLGSLPISNLGQSDFATALDRALSRGVIVVAAAGNDTLPLCEQPGTQGGLLCVGAVDRRGSHAFFSSFGFGVNVFAPGGSGAGGEEDILSTYNDGGYTYLAGTSQATPHVAGVAALLVSLGVRGQAAVQRILTTLSPSGVLSASAAVSGLTAPAGPAPSSAATPAAPASPARAKGAHPRHSHRHRRRHRHGHRRRHHRHRAHHRRATRHVARHR